MKEFTFEERRRGSRGAASVKIRQKRTAGVAGWADERSTTQTVTAAETATSQPQLATTF